MKAPLTPTLRRVTLVRVTSTEPVPVLQAELAGEAAVVTILDHDHADEVRRLLVGIGSDAERRFVPVSEGTAYLDALVASHRRSSYWFTAEEP